MVDNKIFDHCFDKNRNEDRTIALRVKKIMKFNKILGWYLRYHSYEDLS